MDKVQMHLDICKELNEIFKRKNSDYGDAFARLREEYPDAILFFIEIKFRRLKTLLSGKERQVEDESIENTLFDLANYCIMEGIERRIKRCTESIAVKKQ
ncbi:DUF1599 domain-containing protein [bacterium]|nr:DUF1599 domain-containing protein [Elusimicrobiota bacterium]MBR6301169.1 DUF1599 domain-containing protein [bacterium]